MKTVKGLQVGSKGPLNARKHDLKIDQLCKVLWPFLSAGKPRNASSFLPMKCLEGLQGKVLSALKLVPRGQLLLSQGQEGNALGSDGVTCDINSLRIVGIISRSPQQFANWP